MKGILYTLLISSLLGLSLTTSATGPKKKASRDVSVQIIDAHTQEPLTGARVYVPSLDIELVSDLDGYVSFSSQKGIELNLEVNAMSYYDKSVQLPVRINKKSSTILLRSL